MFLDPTVTYRFYTQTTVKFIDESFSHRLRCAPRRKHVVVQNGPKQTTACLCRKQGKIRQQQQIKSDSAQTKFEGVKISLSFLIQRMI